MIDAQALKDYVGVDYADEATERMIDQSLSAAYSYLSNGICDPLPDPDPPDPELNQVLLMVAADFFESRGTASKEIGASKRMYQSMMQQLRARYTGDG